MSDAPRLPLSKRCLGLDIGGAHLKAATARGVAKQLLFPLWRRPEELSGAVARLLEIAPPHGALAVTMTGELCDCFESKAEGVAAIVDAVERSAGGRTTRYYTLEGQFVDAEQAVERWSLVAAANWHAMAAALARRDSSRDAALLVDVGSTTSDIVPFSSFGVLLEGCPDDTARLVAGNLLYQGVGRTPVCAVVDHLPYRGAPAPVAAELFATTADAAVLVGEAPPSSTADTADNRPLTAAYAAARMARMIGADTTSFDGRDAVEAARHVVSVMERRLAATIVKAAEAAPEPPKRCYVGGAGEWLARRAAARALGGGCVRSLTEKLGREASLCGPAWAVAWLAEGAPDA